MNIALYTGYFHDGGLDFIVQKDNCLEIWMESCEITPENEINDKIELSKNHSITGKLHIKNIKNILINDIPYSTLVKDYDCGLVLDLEIKNNLVLIFVEWVNFPPKDRVHIPEEIIIEGENIYWENIPDLLENPEKYAP